MSEFKRNGIMLRRFLWNISTDFPTISSSKNGIKYYHTTNVLRNSNPCDKVTEIENENVADFYAGKSVFITGGTGFLGKVLIERLLYKCKNIDKIYVLVREKRGVKAKERLKDITDNALFSKLNALRPSDINKIVPIAGDISSYKLGMNNEDIATLIDKVSVVFHSAAEVRFDKPLKFMVKANIESTRELLNLSRQFKSIEAFVYVSTAFSNVEKRTIDESVYPPPRNLNEVYEFIENGEVGMKEFLNGKPNIYTFSKALAETVVIEHHGNIPTVIVRPSIVCCSKTEPIPGWLDNWFGAAQLLYNASKGLNRVIPGKKTVTVNFIPVDYTINLMIVAAARCRMSIDVKVYNSCNSMENSVSLSSFINSFIEEYDKINHGNQSKFYYSSSPWVLKILTWFIHVAPAYLLDFWLRCNGEEPRYIKALYPTFFIQDTYLYFLSNNFSWNISNTLNLYHSLSSTDRENFPFDPSELKWKEYIKDYCAGFHKYLVTSNTNK